MAVVLQPWQILLAGLAGWISRQQDAVIDYLRDTLQRLIVASHGLIPDSCS